MPAHGASIAGRVVLYTCSEGLDVGFEATCGLRFGQQELPITLISFKKHLEPSQRDPANIAVAGIAVRPFGPFAIQCPASRTSNSNFGVAGGVVQ
ncbi:MAG: hypothetical protein CM1200mP9_03650 [Gammaproteobacteria bacterium]|nr:MAG: hypothetical protein CM1200mP9_03650 [Gammaproteobacteria bacterium]